MRATGVVPPGADPAADITREICTYTKCYCEENVHRLIATLVERGVARDASDLFVVFISNPSKSVPLWAQKAAREGCWGGLVVWDYHVVLLQEDRQEDRAVGP